MQILRTESLVPGLVLLALTFLLVACGPAGDRAGSNPLDGEPLVEYAIAIHGGAFGDVSQLTEEEVALYEAGLLEALAAAEEILAGGGASLDAVEAAVRRMEDDPLFNAGKGAVFTADGRQSLDAAIMDGSTLACGAVAGVTRVRNPIRLARLVMARSPHVLLAGDGAETFSIEQGMQPVDPAYFQTERRQRQWEEWRETAEGSGHGTVGAVALDVHGRLAAATSTGGITGKRWGRVGDVPIIGAGTYANDASCAVSCTGRGEEFIRHAVSHEVSALMIHGGLSLAEAVRRVIHDRLEPGMGGLIAVSRRGQIVAEFNTGGMLRGTADSTGRHEVVVR